MSAKVPRPYDPAIHGDKPPASPAPPPLKRFPGAAPTANGLITALSEATPEQLRLIRSLLGL